MELYGIVYGLGILKNVLKPNALKFIGVGTVSKQKTESRAYLYAFQSHTHFNIL